MSDTTGIGTLKKDGQEIYPKTKAEAVSYTDSEGNRKTVQALVAEVEALKNNAPQFKSGITWDELEGLTD